MSTLRRLLFFAVLCFGLNFTNGIEKVVHRSYIKADDSSMLYLNNINAFWSSNNIQNLTYVTCPRTYGQKVERNCTVAFHTRPVKSCPVTLKTIEPQVIDYYLEVFPFGPSRAIIFWAVFSREGPTHIKCTIVNLTTCESKHLELPMITDDDYEYLLSTSNYVIHEDSFEFIIADSVDKSKNLNKYHIDSEGNFLSKLEPWCKTDQNIISAYPIVVNSEMKSFLNKGWSWSETNNNEILRRWSLPKCNGSAKVLKQIPLHMFDRLAEDISITHNTIGIAVGANKLRSNFVDVSQFDLDGNHKSNMTFNFTFLVEDLSLLNLADGGFILIVGGSDSYSDRNQYLQLLKISGDQKIIRSVKKVEAYSCVTESRTNTLTLKLFENEAKEYCVEVLCRRVQRYNTGIHDKQFAELLVKCYTDDDFTEPWAKAARGLQFVDSKEEEKDDDDFY